MQAARVHAERQCQAALRQALRVHGPAHPQSRYRGLAAVIWCIKQSESLYSNRKCSAEKQGQVGNDSDMRLVLGQQGSS